MVIPAPAKGRSPESIATSLSLALDLRFILLLGVYGVRARAFVAPRNDSG
jgi:hypothetical protein